MKKMILLGVFAIALIATTSVGANESMENERAEKNVEVLRDGEVLTPIGGSDRPYQSQGYCTIWSLKSMCSSSGAHACKKDC